MGSHKIEPQSFIPKPLALDPVGVDPSLQQAGLASFNESIEGQELDRPQADPEDISGIEDQLKLSEKDTALLNTPEAIKMIESTKKAVLKGLEVEENPTLAEIVTNVLVPRADIFRQEREGRDLATRLSITQTLEAVKEQKAIDAGPSPFEANRIVPGVKDLFTSKAFENIALEDLDPESTARGGSLIVPEVQLRREGGLRGANLQTFQEERKLDLARREKAPTPEGRRLAAAQASIAESTLRVQTASEASAIQKVGYDAALAGLQVENLRLDAPLVRKKLIADTDLAKARALALAEKMANASKGISPAIDKEFGRTFTRIAKSAGVVPFIDPVTQEVNATALWDKNVDQEALQNILRRHSTSMILTPSPRNRQRFGEWLDIVQEGVRLDVERKALIDSTLTELNEKVPASENAGQKNRRWSEELQRWFISDGTEWAMQ